MKNLKKVLALVLVVATLFGFATVVGATDFSDSASVKNTEAVEVMNALGVINGYTDGSFKPNGNVTRAEMAKMVTMILNGGEDVGPLYSAGNVFADCGYHWARGYIAYASNVKLVAGVGNNKFDPDGNVTGAQAAKMLLCALGYDAGAAGYTGGTWASKVLADAKAAGLLDGFSRTFDFSAPLNRDNAALMMLNALKADMVEYTDKGSSVTIGGVEIVTGASAPTPVKDENHPGKGNINNEGAKNYVIQLGEECFENGTKSLKYNSNTPDAFGRPSHVWTYDGDEINTYSNASDVTYTDEVKWNDIKRDTGKLADAAVGTITMYVDGATTGSYTVSDYKSTVTFAESGAGVLTEIYLSDNASDATKTDIRIVVINTYAATISDYVAEKTNKSGDVTTEEGIKLDGITAAFETHDFTEDDEGSWVLYTKTGTGAGATIQEVIVPETVEGTMSRYSTSAGEITVNGTKYALSEKYGTNVASIQTPDFDGTYTYYLDTYGNVIAAEVVEAGSAGNYVYVERIKESADTFESTSGVQAYVVATDGTRSLVKVASSKSGNVVTYTTPDFTNKDGTVEDATFDITQTTTSNPTYPQASIDIGVWASYSVNSKDEYTFKAVDGTVAEVKANSGDNKILSKDSPAFSTISTSKYINSKTVVTNIDDDYKVTTFTGLPKSDVTIGTASVLITYAKGSNAAVNVYIAGQNKALTNDDVTYAYYIGTAGANADGTLYEFAIDGENRQLNSDPNLSGLTAGDVVSLTISDETITSVDTSLADATTNGYKKGCTFSSDSDGVLTLTGTGAGTYTLGDGYAVYDVSSDANTKGESSSATKDDTVTVVFEDSKPVVVFITLRAE